MKLFTIVVISLALGACAADTSDPSTPTITRDQARSDALSGKTDGPDICEALGWYDDAICDEFCPLPDPDCGGGCTSDFMCPQPFCSLGGPCPSTICVEGECLIDYSTDECPAGQRECATCYGNHECTPFGTACPAVLCAEPPPFCESDERFCFDCEGVGFCQTDAAECPDVICDRPPEGCLDGMKECSGCFGSVLCTPESESCPIPLCTEPPDPEILEDVCEESCHYSNDGECDDGGPGSDYSVCDIGTDCSDCGVRGVGRPIG